MASVRRVLFAIAVFFGFVAAPTAANAGPGPDPDQDRFDELDTALAGCTGTVNSPTQISLSGDAVDVGGTLEVNDNCYVVLDSNGKNLRTKFFKLGAGSHVTLKNSTPSAGEFKAWNGHVDDEFLGSPGEYGPAAIKVPQSSTLVIQSGKISAYAWHDGSYTGGAAIGADENGTAGTINIQGGDVTAEAKSGAAIGGGVSSGGGTITISGGEVFAKSHASGAGIGAARSSSSPWAINISGVNTDIEAYGGFWSAGIGGAYSSTSTVTIDDATIYAKGGSGGSGIGGGRDGSGDSVTINGGDIEAWAGEPDYEGGAAGIGRAYGASGNSTITIHDGTIKAYGSEGGAGIGDGGPQTSEKTTVLIDGGTIVHAFGGGYEPIDDDGDLIPCDKDAELDDDCDLGNGGAGIGGGYGSEEVVVTITGDAEIGWAQGGESAAGVGGGVNNGDVTVNISDDDVTVTRASGAMAGAGIGGGENNDTVDVNISGGYITYARGGYGWFDPQNPSDTEDGWTYSGGAGIGGAYGSGTLDVSITGGTIEMARGGYFAAGIGSGGGATGPTNISISGGSEVYADGGDGGSGIGGVEYDSSRYINIEITGNSTTVEARAGGDSYNEDWGACGCAGVAIGNSDVGSIGTILIGNGALVEARGWNAVGFGQAGYGDDSAWSEFSLNGELRIPDEDGRLYLPEDFTMDIGTTGKIIGDVEAPRDGAYIEGDQGSSIDNDGIIALSGNLVDIAVFGNHFQVAFDGNGADSGVPQDSEVVFGPSFSAGYRDLPTADDMVRAGYEFLGWEVAQIVPSSFSPASSGLPFDEGTEFLGSSGDGDPVELTLVAQWGVDDGSGDGSGDGSNLPGTGATIALLLLMLGIGGTAAGVAARKRVIH